MCAELLVQYKRILSLLFTETIVTSPYSNPSQAKNFKTPGSQGRWPKKSAQFLIHLLHNAESNAEVKMLNTDALVIEHIQINRAAKVRRRTYRAHGRINRKFGRDAVHTWLLTDTKGHSDIIIYLWNFCLFDSMCLYM